MPGARFPILPVSFALAASALVGCWDSVASPIRVRPDGGAAGGDADGGPDSGTRDAGPPGGMLNLRHCQPVADSDWPEDAALAEIALHMAINGLRTAERPRCDGRDYRRQAPLPVAPELRCAARLHSLDMVTRDFVRTVNPSGEYPRDRVAQTGIPYDWVEETVLSGGNEPDQAFDNLSSNRESCERMLSQGWSGIGIGLHQERWTVDFGDRFGDR